jgi:hypothetical protein
MKNLTSLIKENSETKKYKYTATVVVEGNVTAMSEGDAGELVDKELDTIANVVNYKIDSIDEIESGVQENFDQFDGHAPEVIVEKLYNDIIDIFETAQTEAGLTDYHHAMLRGKLKMYFEQGY